ncbi:hypothetical protein [Flavobacterium sp. UBA7682]|uniref:hypothetical protein n=1 Tax=Flavobacterium sp. UBA7682 TaxID=1946560 RepID=UPI0025BC1CBC|nr:hypothetical protein [Flavobacterium sp. UBA7682]
MPTKAQLARWRDLDIPFDGFYDTIAKDEPVKKLEIRYVSFTEDKANFIITFNVTGTSLKKKVATMTMVALGDPFNSVSYNNLTINPDGSSNLKLNFPKRNNQNALFLPDNGFESNPTELLAFISCDGISSTVVSVPLTKAAKKEEKVESAKCFCSKAETGFSKTDWENLITLIRKQENPQLVPDMNYKTKPPTVMWIDTKTNEVLPANANGKAPTPNSIKHYIPQTKYDEKDDGVQIKNRLFYMDDADLNVKESQRNYSEFAKQMNYLFTQHEIKTCIQKIHFLSQIYVETQGLSKTYEDPLNTSPSGGEFYRGRGLLHLTHDYNYLAYYDDRNNTSYLKTYKENKKKIIYYTPKKHTRYQTIDEFYADPDNKDIAAKFWDDFIRIVKLVSTDLFFACDTAGWYWETYKINDIATDEDLSVARVSLKINNSPYEKFDSKHPRKGINSYDERVNFFNIIKKVFNEGCK